MMTENAVVIGERGDRALVRTRRGEACDGCHAQGACNMLGGGKDFEFEVLNPARARVGDRVELVLPESSFLKASVITYLIPLFCLLGGALLGQAVSGRIGWSENATSILFAAAGLGLALIVVIVLNKKVDAKAHYTPRIIRVLPRELDGGGTIPANGRNCGS